MAVHPGTTHRSAGLVLPLAALTIVLSGQGLGSARAAVMGAAPAKPMPEAVSRTRQAAEAVLAGAGTQSCLTGKLTNALLGLSSSCEAQGERSALCQLADKVVVTTGWDMAFLESTARRLLELIETPVATTP